MNRRAILPAGSSDLIVCAVSVYFVFPSAVNRDIIHGPR